MEVLWNQISLQRPPYRSWDVPVKEFDSRKFIQLIEKILNEFKVLELLNAEAAVLSRLIYRMKSKFRSDKGLKHMEKVNRALLNYLNMSIPREYELLKECIEITDGIVSLPPKQTLEYVLVRTQGFAKLMCRVESCAMIAGNFLKSRLQIGQAWAVAMIAYGVISRIWVLSRHIVKRTCIWYNSIYNCTEIFKTVGIPWLPDNYTLPEDLSQWLNLPWFNEEIEKISMTADGEKSIFNLIKTNVEDEEELNLNNSKVETLKCAIDSSNVDQNTSIFSQESDRGEDIGSKISRHEFEASQKNSKELKKKSEPKKNCERKKLEKKSKLQNIQSKKDLLCLLKEESFPGLDKLQWQILRKRVKKLLKKLTKNNTCDVDATGIQKVIQCIKEWTDPQ